MTARQLLNIEESESPLFVGVDVGGTSIKAGLVDNQGHTLAFDKIPTDEERGAEDAVRRTAELTDRVLAQAGAKKDQIAWLGLGTPGTMDIPAGMILEPPNMPTWRHFPIRDRLAELTGLPVAFANDAGAAAYGEYWLGTGREFNSIVLLTLGTGVGGGIILPGGSIDGENSHGSECGHIIIDSSEQARECSCGQLGHLEAYASATAVAKRTAERLAEGPESQPSSLRQRVADGEELTSLMVAEEAEKGDDLARRIVMETADYLGIAIVTLVHVIDPGAVILGGAMDFGGNDSPLGSAFRERIRHVFRSRTFPLLARRTEIDFARLGGDAGYLGAAGIARAALREAHR